MKIKEVTDYLDETFHPEYQEDYDNSGFLIGDGRWDYRGALVTLDVTPRVVAEAVAGGFSLIVAHHPIIFGGVKRLTDGSELGRMAIELFAHRIGVYAAHTNLDNLAWGVSGELCRRLGMEGCRVLQPKEGRADVGSGMVGELPQAEEVDALLRRVKELTGQPSVRTSAHDGCRRVKRVALCGGAGSFLIGDALRAGAEVYITADLKYHDFQRTDGSMMLADIGHYESEQFARQIIFERISEKFSNFACRISAEQKGLVEYI